MSSALISLASNKAQDDAGARAEELLKGSPAQPVVRETIQPDLMRLKGVLQAALADPRFGVLIVVGDLPWHGCEAVASQVTSLLERRLDGFGQFARTLLMEHSGRVGDPSDALFTWSGAGAIRSRLVMALPGNVHQLEVLLERMVIPQWPRLLEWAKG